jgi:hypothetical protein
MTKIQKVNYIVVHHSASSTKMKMEDLKAIHLKEGYSDIGYHKVIEGDGKVRQGRSDLLMGAQAKGLNGYSLGVCVVGNFEEIEVSESQEKSLVQVLASLCKRYKLGADKIIGHRDVARIIKDPSIATLCPGKNLYKKLRDIREKVKGYL